MKQALSICLFLSMLHVFAQESEGVVSRNLGSAQGYVLFSPLNSKITYLVDKCGNLVHSWASKYNPAQSVYLLPDGSILRTGNDSIQRGIPSVGGKIERFDWDNKLLWSYSLSNEKERLHHDIYPMPNGNVLAIAYRKRTKGEAAAAGRRPSDQEAYLLDEKILEIKPLGRDSGIIVWQWDVWDHIIQDINPKATNYGVVAQNPQLLNINFNPSSAGPDWLHFNSVSYNASLDQIIVSIHEFSELFIIDHSTTTLQAASHKGGKRGKGGDLLYRWGNPAAYGTGSAEDQKLFRQHNAHWIEKGLEGEGKIMVFNNGLGRGQKFYSSVEIIEPPMNKKGDYILEPGKIALPLTPSWNYTAVDTACFFSKNISGAQRLANGNTLICAGQIGKFFEIDSNKNIVWTFLNVANHTAGQVFRCTFYEPTYGAFKGRKLAPCTSPDINTDAHPCFSK